MARLRPTKPTISLSLLLSEGVRIRTTISPLYPERQAQDSTGGPALRDTRPDGPENAYANALPGARTPLHGVQRLSKQLQVQIGEGRRVRNLVRAGANAQDPGGGTRATQELYQTISRIKKRYFVRCVMRRAVALCRHSERSEESHPLACRAGHYVLRSFVAALLRMTSEPVRAPRSRVSPSAN